MRVIYFCAFNYPKVWVVSLKSRGLTRPGRIGFTEESSQIHTYTKVGIDTLSRQNRYPNRQAIPLHPSIYTFVSLPILSRQNHIRIGRYILMNLSTYTKENLTILLIPNHTHMNLDLYERELDTYERDRIIPKRVAMYTKEHLTILSYTESPTFGQVDLSKRMSHPLQWKLRPPQWKYGYPSSGNIESPPQWK